MFRSLHQRAGRRAPIAWTAVERAVVALLAGRQIEQRIAAHRQGTIAVARRAFAGRVALLAGVDDAVAAELELTLRGAAIAVDRVAVVALLTGRRIDQPVTAHRKGAVAVAEGGLPEEVALLTGIEEAIATDLEAARRGAAIAGDLVAVVALLAEVEDTIATDLELTLRGAAVAADRVAVVALLAGVEQAVAALREPAGAIAAVAVAPVAIVALFSGLHDAVAAHGECRIDPRRGFDQRDRARVGTSARAGPPRERRTIWDRGQVDPGAAREHLAAVAATRDPAWGRGHRAITFTEARHDEAAHPGVMRDIERGLDRHLAIDARIGIDRFSGLTACSRNDRDEQTQTMTDFHITPLIDHDGTPCVPDTVTL